jgi:hypothetical protein
VVHRLWWCSSQSSPWAGYGAEEEEWKGNEGFFGMGMGMGMGMGYMAGPPRGRQSPCTQAGPSKPERSRQQVEEGVNVSIV